MPQELQRCLPPRLAALIDEAAQGGGARPPCAARRTVRYRLRPGAVACARFVAIGEIGIDRWILDRARPDDTRLAGLRRALGERQRELREADEAQDEVERIYQKDGVSFKEEYRKDGSSAEMSVMLANGVMVELTGDNVDMDGLRGALAALDIKGLAGLKREK